MHKFESVVILFPDEETKAYYEKEVLPIYFPRNLIELQRSREEAMECDENGGEGDCRENDFDPTRFRVDTILGIVVMMMMMMSMVALKENGRRRWGVDRSRWTITEQ